jgi:hypothetical protein
MVGQHVLAGQIQSQAMSHAKFVFLIALVIFFVALFVAAYVWMRRPDFGQKGAHARTTTSDAQAVPPGRAGGDRSSVEVTPGRCKAGRSAATRT